MYTDAKLPEGDRGIQRALTILLQNGIETFESCEVGPGHSYPEPTVRFYGNPAAGWRALRYVTISGCQFFLFGASGKC